MTVFQTTRNPTRSYRCRSLNSGHGLPILAECVEIRGAFSVTAHPRFADLSGQVVPLPRTGFGRRASLPVSVSNADGLFQNLTSVLLEFRVLHPKSTSYSRIRRLAISSRISSWSSRNAERTCRGE